ncbi:MAG: lysophospholipase [Halanaerobiales bacterium]|nr:lysophospholipase [Halanaerobiales bacterium]
MSKQIFKESRRTKIKKKRSTKKLLLYALLTVILIIIIISLLPGKTSPILDQNGKKLKDSISVMEKVNIGGVNQWVVTRGKSKDNPIILLLSGGPGGTEMGRFLKFNAELEDHFIVVIWEQRGSGKSYPSIKVKDKMTLDQYVLDINELTNYLKEKYEKDKIYLLGHSWGTIIGTLAVQRYPKQFHAYIGAAQMIDIVKTDKYIYEFVLNAARNNGDQKLVDELIKNGEPPYSGDKVLNEYKPVLTNY